LQGFWISDILDAIERNDTKTLNHMKSQGLDLVKIASNIFHSGFHQAFEEEVFHADPHAGNLVVLENNVIGYIDFGITGQLSERFRTTQLTILNALEEGRLDRYAYALLRLFNPPPQNVNIEEFQEEVKRNAHRWINNFYNPKASLREHSSASLLMRNLVLAREYGLSFAQVAIRYYRALLVAELIVLRLNPTFNFRQEIRVYFTRYGLRSVMRGRVPSRLMLTTLRTRDLLRNVPDIFTDFVGLTEREVLTVRTAVSNVRIILARLFKTLALIGLGIIVLTPVLYIFFPQFYKALIPVDLRFIVGTFIILVPFWAWLSRLLDIYSVQRGIYIRSER
jgi:ubiquinone biosynthesis protein